MVHTLCSVSEHLTLKSYNFGSDPIILCRFITYFVMFPTESGFHFIFVFRTVIFHQMMYQLLLFTVTFILLTAQEIGHVPIKKFQTVDYFAGARNYISVQHPSGIIYVGNEKGLLEYDGVEWKKLSINNAEYVRSLAISSDSILYVGAYNEFGYFKTDSNRVPKYVSLSTSVNTLSFGDVWQITETSRGILFRTKRYIFLSDGENIIAQYKDSPTSFFQNAGEINHSVYTFSLDRGFFQIQRDSLVKKETHIQLGSIYGIFQLPDNKGLFINRKGQFYQFTKNTFYKVQSEEIEKYIKKNNLKHIQKLSSGRLALSTDFGGILIASYDGKILEIIDQRSGLKIEPINHVMEDYEGNLWASTGSGVVYIQKTSRVTQFGNQSDYSGYISCVTRFKDQLLIATNKGIYTLKNGEQQFSQTKLPKHSTAMLLNTNDKNLIYTTAKGVFHFNNRNTQKRYKYSTSKITESKTHRNLFYCVRPYDSGLLILEYVKNSFKHQIIHHISRHLSKSVFTLEQGMVILQTQANEIFLLDEKDLFPWTPNVPRKKIDIPYKNGEQHLFESNNTIYLSSGNEIFQYNPKENHFFKSYKYSKLDFSYRKLIKFKEFNNDLWCITLSHNGQTYLSKAVLKDDFYVWDESMNIILRSYPAKDFFIEEGNVWFYSYSNLFLLNTKKQTPLNIVHRKPIVRKVMYQSEHILYSANTSKSSIHLELEQSPTNIRVHYVQPAHSFPVEYIIHHTYNDSIKSYQTFDNTITLNHLEAGNHSLRIVSKLGTGLSEATEILMYVPQLWYKKWWVILLLLCLFLGCIYILMRLYSRQLLKRISFSKRE